MRAPKGHRVVTATRPFRGPGGRWMKPGESVSMHDLAARAAVSRRDAVFTKEPALVVERLAPIRDQAPAPVETVKESASPVVDETPAHCRGVRADGESCRMTNGLDSDGFCRYHRE